MILSFFLPASQMQKEVERRKKLLSAACCNNLSQFTWDFVEQDVHIADFDGFGCSLLQRACFNKAFRIVNFLLKQPDIDVNAYTTLSLKTPLHIACENGDMVTVGLLIQDHRVMLNIVNFNGETPIGSAAANFHFDVMGVMIAYCGDHLVIPHNIVSTESFRETDDRFYGGLTNPKAAQMLLRKELFPARIDDAASIFALVVWLSDDFFTIRKDNNVASRRFFKICSKLPIELQMVLCNMSQGSRKLIVKMKDSEPAFDNLENMFGKVKL